MASYQPPPDPRLTDVHTTPRHLQTPAGDTPWLWLGLGLVITCATLFLVYALLQILLVRDPLTINGVQPPPATIVYLTAPPTLEPTATFVLPTPTPIPTLTPAPTRDRTEAPEVITIDYYVSVTGTDGAGLSVRGGPSTDNVRLERVEDGTVMLVLDGPVENEGFVWWKLQLSTGVEGWAVDTYLVPAASP